MYELRSFANVSMELRAVTIECVLLVPCSLYYKTNELGLESFHFNLIYPKSFELKTI